MPKISVIVPVFNVEAYLAECVESVLAQTFPDFELLLVNDASTDGSLALARAYESDPRIKVWDKPHGGLGDTRNYGAARAAGDYLLFVDSDDWIDPDTLENLYRRAEDASADLVVFNFVRENQKDGERRICRLPLNCPDYGEEVNEKLLAELIGPDPGDSPWRGVEMLGCAWRRMYRRSWFREHRLAYYDERKIMLEDLPVSIMAHCSTGRVLAVCGAYYHYRYNPDSLSTRYRPHKMEMLLGCFAVVGDFLRERGLYGRYEERHLAWLLRSAAHSALVNCFSPANPARFGGRWREVRGILRLPEVRRAARSDYFRNGTAADRMIRFLIRTGFIPAVYLFYSFYSRALRKDAAKK